MELHKKSTNELIAQATGRKAYFSFVDYSESEIKANERIDADLRSDLRNFLDDNHTDEEIRSKLQELELKATEAGIFDPTKGEGAQERIKNATDYLMIFGKSPEEASIQALKSLRKNGILASYRKDRKYAEEKFTTPISEFIHENELNPDIERREIESLLESTIEIATITPEEEIRLLENFPSGNFLYHGSKTKQVIEILDSGMLKNSKSLNKDSSKTSKNSGFEGISLSLNGIDALPGDTYHMAGFLVAPEFALDKSTQLSIPSRPAPNEVILISSNVDSNEYFNTKTQQELYRDINLLGEANSVIGNIGWLSVWNKSDDRTHISEPLLIKAKDTILSHPNYENELRKYYSIVDNHTEISPELLQQTNNEIPVCAVWIQSAIDGGKLDDTEFSGLSVIEIINTLDKESSDKLIKVVARDCLFLDKKIDSLSDDIGNVEIPVEKMQLVIPRKDLKKWAKVIARSAHKPAGILLYDDKKIRLENFASPNKGDHEILTQELKTTIKPNENYIDYSKVLGVEFTDDMRAGNRSQIISEKYLKDRKNLKIGDDNRFIIE